MKNRYAQLGDLVLSVSPKVIVEVGVHLAMRAVLMCEVARQRQGQVSYTGYDVFETMNPDFHKRALNGKGIPSQAVATQRLKMLQDRVGGVSHRFVVGDTAKTLHGKRVKCDFAFVDGDHRVEMIRGDAAALDCSCIVFDDYYTPGPEGKLTDLEKYGANQVVDEYRAAGFRVEVLPKQDLTKEGCFASLAVVRR